MQKMRFHPYVPELIDQYKKGKLTRREFLRYAALLGVSLGAASAMVGIPRPWTVFAAKPERGGTLRVSASVHKVTHPAQFSWTAAI